MYESSYCGIFWPSCLFTCFQRRCIFKCGDNTYCGAYGDIFTLLKILIPRFGFKGSFVKQDKPEEFRKKIDYRTKAIHLMSPRI
ncbi:hypothetical protein BDB00DRAFT_517365 [Zychaea mexicana]|uniref:uncharacterized protein n=1 Tax=Zychaea mexicana TaxID=64656 RepID=UPI0022FEC45C|nr:uncharacterized protein BDB00DRAFT_517365 [Zychaea mexicana]KAI9491033.1 hypothetical protein BDB00DRAFT_517365 [Zychaea mexicana]